MRKSRLILYSAASLLFIFGHILACSRKCDEPIETNRGLVAGQEMLSTGGNKFCSFRGIPYAKAPLKQLRFMPPEPMERWTGVFNATQDAPMCAQYNYWFGDVSYSEDCLALNIYTPKECHNHGRKDKCNIRSKLPVMVYIHEGAFTAGEAGMRSKPPQRFMNKCVVLVMIQYRLGVFGFLSTGDSEASGNFGMLDQVFALQWVQKNIEAFGGDAKRVTIFGQSAGGASVTYHLLSPMSKGLFRGAIAQSGTALNYWAFQKNPILWATHLGREMRCDEPNNTGALVECLRYKSAKDILDTFIRLGWNDPGVAPFVPVIENPASGRFLTESPLKLLEKGNINKVPLMTGTTKDESTSLFSVVNNPKFDTIDEAFFIDILPDVLKMLTKYQTNLLNLSYAVKREYFDKIDVSNRSEVVRTVFEVHSDSAFKTGTATTAKLVAKQEVSVYVYLFAHPGNVSASNYTGQKDSHHEIDLFYLYNRTVLSEEDEQFSDELVNMWFNFACQLNPTPDGFNGTEWITSGKDDPLKYLEMGEEMNTLTRQTKLMIERTDFWNTYAPFTDNPNS